MSKNKTKPDILFNFVFELYAHFTFKRTPVNTFLFGLPGNIALVDLKKGKYP